MTPRPASGGGPVFALRPLDPAAPWIEPWRALSARALVDTLAYDPDVALAAAGAYGAGIAVALVGDRAPEAPGLRLSALWPVRRVRTRWGLPLRLAMGWMHDYAVFGAPLLDRDAPDAALAALFAGLGRECAPRLMLTHVPQTGAFAELLARYRDATGGRAASFWAHERAFLDLSAQDPAGRGRYLDHLSRRERRRLDRASQELASHAAMTFETIREPAALAKAFEDYVALEGRGWKGRAGTALAARPAEAAFLRALVARLGGQGRVRVDRLRRGGATLAAALSVTTRGRLWCLKISFDESAARHSPGAQLLRRLTESLVADPAVTTADSCAPPGFRLAETFWAERLALAHVLIEAPGGDPLFPLAVRLERLRAALSRIRARQRAASE